MDTSKDIASAGLSADAPSLDDALAAQILERVSDAFISLDRQWRCLAVNGQAARLLGRPARDLLGKNYWAAVPEFVGQPFGQACHRALREMKPVQTEEHFRPTDRWFETRIYPGADGLSIFFQDITERRRDQERLHESERQLAEAQQIARLGGWEWNIETSALTWSRELLCLVGLDGEEFQPDSETLAPVHPEETASFRQQIQDAIVQGQGLNFESRLLRPDGREIMVRHWGHLVRDAAGRPQRLVAVAQDVTEQREIAAALVESREQFRAIVDVAPVSIVISRLSGGVILYANPFARQLFGVGPEADLSRRVVTDFYQNVPDRAETLRLLSVQPIVGPRELSAKALDGRTILALGSFQRLTYRGEDAVLATHYDITEFKRADAARQLAEENYRALFTNAVEGIFQTSPDGHFLQVNPALADIYGYETPERMMDELTDVGRQLYVDAARRLEFERLMREQGFVSRFESQVRRRDGSVIWISESARPIRDADGALLRYEGFVQEISDRKVLEGRQENALREAIDQADRDALTGLLNHRAFHKRLEEETARAERGGRAIAVVMLDLDNFGFFNNVYGHLVGDLVLRQVADRLREVVRPYDTVARFGGDEFALLLPSLGSSDVPDLEARLAADLSGLSFQPEGNGPAVPITISLGLALLAEDSADRQEALRQADERLMRSKTGAARDTEADQVRALALSEVSGFSMLNALVVAVDNKDRYTRRHSEDVMEYSLKIARELGLGEDREKAIAVAALLHDVGKIGIPDAVLRKPGPLNEDEFHAMRQHPEMGAAIVGAVPGLEETLDAVRHHHERWDGAGYPAGLRGEETPLIARLMAVADAYSAMTTDRPYRKGMTPEAALSLLSEGSGTQWDPACVTAFAAGRG